MTELLEKAFAEATKLPDTEQNELARRILADLESERRWDMVFEQSQDLLAQLAEEALTEHRTDKVRGEFAGMVTAPSKGMPRRLKEFDAVFYSTIEDE